MIARALSLLAVLLLSLAALGNATAGGFASVRLDFEPVGIVAGVPFTVGLTVRSHDVEPMYIDPLVITATHELSGAVVEITATKTAGTGRYTAELNLPEPGAWNWAASPGGLEATPFPTLQVAATESLAGLLGNGNHPAELRTGTCAEPGTLVQELSAVAPANAGAVAGRLSDATPASALTGSTSLIELPAADLLGQALAIMVFLDDRPDALPIACGELAPEQTAGTLASTMHIESEHAAAHYPEFPGTAMVSLGALNGSGYSGLALLTPNGTSTRLDLVLQRTLPATPTATAPAGPVVEIDIVDEAGTWRYEPATVEVAPGTTVIWTNRTTMAHTVTNADPAFADSGLILPGDRYQLTLTEPGEYRYDCVPHPWMKGEVIVVAS